MMNEPKYRLVHPINKLHRRSGRIILKSLPPDVIRSIPKTRRKSSRKKQTPEYVNQLIKNPGVTIFDHGARYTFEKPYWIDAPKDSVQYKVAMKPGRILIRRLPQETIGNYLAVRDCLIKVKKLTESKIRQHRNQHEEIDADKSDLASKVDADQDDFVIDSDFSDDSTEVEENKQLSIEFSFMNETIDLSPSRSAQDSTKHQEPAGHGDAQVCMNLDDTDSEDDVPSPRFIPLFSPMRGEYIWYDTQRNEEYAENLAAENNIPKSQLLDAIKNGKIEGFIATQPKDTNGNDTLIKGQSSTSTASNAKQNDKSPQRKYQLQIEAQEDLEPIGKDQPVEITSPQEYIDLVNPTEPNVHLRGNSDSLPTDIDQKDTQRMSKSQAGEDQDQVFHMHDDEDNNSSPAE